MKNKKGLIAGIVILLILIGVYVGLKVAGPEEDKKQTEEKEITAFEVKAEDISKVSIENDGVLYTFVKEEDTWKYAEDENLPLNQAVVSNIISGLTSVKAQRELKDIENPADYGLSEPKLKATITDKNNAETVLNFGDDNEAVSGAYMSVGNNEKIYLVNSTVKTDLQFEKNDLAEMEELPQIAVGNIKKVEISRDNGVKTLQEEEAGGLWTLYKEDGSQISVDTAKVNDYMNHFSSLSLMDFVSYDTNNLSFYGLDNPKKVTVFYEEEQESEDTSEEAEDENAEEEEPVMVAKEFVLLVGNTDENGNYVAEGLYSENVINLGVDRKTIDPMTKHTKGILKVKARKSAGMKIDIPISIVSMVTGNIWNTEDFEEREFIQALTMTTILLEKDGEVIDEIDPEFDGMFFFEDVPAGKYKIKFQYIGQENIGFSNPELDIEVKLENTEEGEYFEGFDTEMRRVEITENDETNVGELQDDLIGEY